MIRFGTCSWKYDSWRGLVYDDLTRKEDYLFTYAKKYNTVEIDQWFWSLFGPDKLSLPRASVVADYAASVPDDFRFTIKMPNSLTLTNYYKSVKGFANQINPYFLSHGLLEDFLNSIEPLLDRTGMLMFQFEYLNREKMSHQSEFIERLADFFDHAPDLPYGLEIRNPNYLNTNWFRFLDERELSHVFLQGYFMPPVIQSFNKFSTYINRPAVIRLHGPDRSDIETKSGGIWDRLLEPKDDELAQITKIIRALHSKNLDVYVNVNNHYEGSAPLTIKKMLEAIGE